MTAPYDHADDEFMPDGSLDTREAFRFLADAVEAFANDPHDPEAWLDMPMFADYAMRGMVEDGDGPIGRLVGTPPGHEG